MISTRRRIFDEHVECAFRHLSKAQEATKANRSEVAGYHLELAEEEVKLMRSAYNRLEERANAPQRVRS